MAWAKIMDFGGARALYAGVTHALPRIIVVGAVQVYADFESIRFHHLILEKNT